MAKWGKGDPRWIVEERPDATNVNNWHWTERDASHWSQEKLSQLLLDLRFQNFFAEFHITKVEICDGEAILNNRKGKLIYFYDWKIVLKWYGFFLENPEEEFEGYISIRNLSEDYSPSDVQVDMILNSNSDDALRFRDLVGAEARFLIKHQIEKYVDSLKEDFAKGMILPKKDEEEPEFVPNPPQQPNKVEMAIENSEPSAASTLSMRVNMRCTKEELFNALTNVELVQAFTNGPAIMDARVGGKFEIFGGDICGEFLELVPYDRFSQKWRFKAWPEGHYSSVYISIKQLADSAELLLTQKNVPLSEIEATTSNWNQYYWTPLRTVFQFGPCLTP